MSAVPYLSPSLETADETLSVAVYLGHSDEAPPALRLFAQVLRRAVVDYVIYRDSTTRKHKKYSEDAYRWMYVDPEGTFTSLCIDMGLDPAVVREHAATMSEDEARMLRKLEFSDSGGHMEV